MWRAGQWWLRGRSASSRAIRCSTSSPPRADRNPKSPQFACLLACPARPHEPFHASAMSGNLFDLIRSRVPAPDKALLELADGRQLSYADAFAWSGRVANTLVLRGVEPGDRVAVQVEKSPEALILYLAVLRAGAVYLQLNTAYTLAELEYFLSDAEPKVVVCDPARRAEIEAIAQKCGVAS